MVAATMRELQLPTSTQLFPLPTKSLIDQSSTTQSVSCISVTSSLHKCVLWCFCFCFLLKKGKSAGVDIPTELVQAGGENVITALTTICNKIWQTGEWQTPWTQSLVITLPKKGNLQQCQNYRTISLISHPNKVMLKIILNRLKPQAEIIAEEQAGFRAGRSTTE